jgi:hypothetical protein
VQINQDEKVRITVDSIETFLELGVDFQFSLQVAIFFDYRVAALRMNNADGFECYVVHFSILPSRSLLLLAFWRRDPTSHEFAIQVGTPSHGKTQRINTMYPAKRAINPNQSGMSVFSFAAINDW